MFEQFVEQANTVHKNLYTYPKQIYKNNGTALEIVCSKHGSFWQKPIHHIHSKSGCLECKKEKLSKLNTKTFIQFKEEAIKIHSGFYGYPDQEYIGTDSKYIIICPKHR